MSSTQAGALAALQAWLDDLVARGVVPGGAAAVVGPEGVRWRAAFGSAAVEPQREPATLGTIWDCASLTKPLLTAAIALRLAVAGAWRLDDAVTRWVPELASRSGGPRSPTLAEILTHAAGLPAWEPLPAIAGNSLAARALHLALVREQPGVASRYGCPAYQVLALALDRLAGEPHAAVAARLLSGAGVSWWYPPSPELVARCAATERGNAFERRLAGDRAAGYDGWRRDVIRGEVHDHAAHTVGGAGGNSGLFATVDGVAELVRPWLAPEAWVGADMAAGLRTRRDPGGAASEARTWGWQMAESESAPADPAVSPGALAHSGFTGTSVVVDQRRAAAFVLLTNRIHPRWTDHPFNRDRRVFHALAANAWDEELDA